MKYTNKRLENALGLGENSFKNRGATHSKYRDKKNLTMFSEFEQNDIVEYVHTQCVIEITKDTIAEYIDYVANHNEVM